MKKIKDSIPVSGLAMLVLGVLFLIFQSGIVGLALQIAITVWGIFMIVTGVLDVLRGQLIPGIVKAVLGVAAIVLGWVVLTVIVWVVAILLMVTGVLELFQVIKAGFKSKSIIGIVLALIYPILTIIIGASLVFGAAFVEFMNILFIVAGILLIVEGIIEMVSFFAPKK